VGEKHVDGFEMCAGHCKNVRRAIDQFGGKRLAALIADVYAFGFAHLYGVKTRRLPPHCVNSRGSDFDILAIANEPTKEPFRDGTAADIAGADEENAFHDRVRAAGA
jgi:hypothetical protein